MIPYLRDGFLHLPSALLSFLRAPRILKVGVHVKADLTRLFNDCGLSHPHDQPFVGALEIGALAKQHNVTTHANHSLADLTSIILHCHLPKDPGIRLSLNWDNPILTEAQQQYAALDAYAAWCLFDTIASIPKDGMVTNTTIGGTKVKLLG